ncbi:MAG: pyridoxamine 5'-phosphate oxidase family protein [Clostridia bacterium]|nr:pyridoxamine 5'-phosphate oxidase family protein [Clostridia bacterium]
MQKLTEDVKRILMDRFGRDSVIALATAKGNIPYVRSVNAYYDDGAFYVLTYGRSDKMKQIEENPVVAVSGDWFTAHGRGVSLGWFGAPENRAIAERMQEVFAGWIHNGHNDFEDENTCILKIVLTEGILFSNGTRYGLEFGE